MWCKTCEEGDAPHVLDVDGVRSELSGKEGVWAHAHEDNWWPCQRKAAEEHAIVDKLPKTADDVPVIVHERPVVWVWTKQFGLYRPGQKEQWREMVVYVFHKDTSEFEGYVDGSHYATHPASDCYSTPEAAEAANPDSR